MNVLKKGSLFWGLFLLCLCSCQDNPEKILVTTPSVDSIFMKADQMYDAGNKTEPLKMVLQARTNAQNLTVADQVNFFNYFNVRYGKLKDYNRVIENSDSMLLYLNDQNEKNKYIKRWKTVAYNAKADALFAKGLYNDAYDYYYKAKKLATENADSCSLRTYAYSLAMVLYKQQRFLESAHYFIEAYGECAACEEDFNLFYFKQEILDNTGLCYSAVHRYDSAMIFYNMALNYLNEKTGKYKHKEASVYEAPKAVVYGNMAEVLVNQGKYDSAKILYNKSININLQKGYTNSDALVDQSKLAHLYFQTGDLSMVKKTLDAIKEELDTIPEQRVEISWNKLMWQYYEREHDSLAAFRHLRSYMLQNDAYNASNKSLMTTDIDTRVKDLEKQYNINLLTKDRKQQKIILIIVTIIAVMALVIVLLVWRNARKSQKNVRLLTELNNTISEQKAQLEEALEELRNNEKDKVRILKSVAHDVMNPIAAIFSLIDILSNESQDYTEAQIEIMDLIRDACATSLNLSKDILEASVKIEQTNIEKENTDINRLLARSVELLNYQAIAKNQHIRLNMPEEHIFAYVYKEKIWRVFNNLIANAIKFSYSDSEIIISLEKDGDDVHIAIQDRGVGIPEQNKPYVFDMFTDAKMTGTSGEAPHGLGLSISLHIAKAHNGNIWFESEEGRGTTFHVVFPQYAPVIVANTV